MSRRRSRSIQAHCGWFIEQAFSKIKNILRKLGARTHEALLEALEEALREVSAWDAAGWFDHCGYQVEIQYLGMPL